MSTRFRSGLYDESFEKGSCGIGLVANPQNLASHEIIKKGLEILKNLAHRSALSADGSTSDGAGILTQIPDSFFRQELKKKFKKDILPLSGHYAVAQIFLGKKEPDGFRTRFHEKAQELGFSILAYRSVPVESTVLGELAKSTEPQILQVFLTGPDLIHAKSKAEISLFRLRRWCEKTFRAHSGCRDPKTGQPISQLFVCSLSSSTIVYKGLMQPKDLALYYRDLLHPEFKSQMVLAHCRFSTNTLPAWELAQPFRHSCHNGEINTIQSNRNWMKSREKEISEKLLGYPEDQILPLLSENRSDSNSFDEALELLFLMNYSTPQALMSLIPEPWGESASSRPELEEFYRFQSRRLEPWDGPAAICFSNGKILGACLDRNGLRPCRYEKSEDGTIVVSSEAGALPIEPELVREKGRLKPGTLLLIDLESGEIDLEGKSKLQVAMSHPYQEWNEKETIQLNPTLQAWPQAPSLYSLSQFGFHYDEILQVLLPLFKDKEEVSSSMGSDTPLAVLSDHPQLLFQYFRQLFAQVTNPPIDSIRERSVMSLHCYLGSRGSLSEISSDHKKRWLLEHPVLASQQMIQLHQWTEDSQALLKTSCLDCLFHLDGPETELEQQIQSLCDKAEQEVRNGAEVLILSDRSCTSKLAAIPSLLITSAIHHHLVKKQMRTRTSLVIQTSEVRDVHQMACLLSFGADAVHPSLIEGLIQSLLEQGYLPLELSPQKAWDHYCQAISKGLLKILSKLGISTLQSYCGAQTFEILGLSKEIVDAYFCGTVSRIGGLDLQILTEEIRRRWRQAESYSFSESDLSSLPSRGDVHYRINGESHQWSPLAIAHLQTATRQKDWKSYRQFSEEIQNSMKGSLRGHLLPRSDRKPIAIEEVEPAVEIVKRFTTGAMSLGALSREAHETLAIAMNQIGAQSNSGEGGEDPDRFENSRNSSIKQIASARFGVTTNYLVHANEIQIKMAQGAKPGEGGQLPGHKVNSEIARLRHSIEGVTLISPPPHHDIYSIEDLAQLIFDLKNVNPKSRISVKLVAKAGVGTIAAGVVKAGAHKILISGDGGGTGASPLSSIRHAGIPWEMGIAETHQTLVLNGLRSQVQLETDGQLRTGHDVLIAAILGAEEFGFSTAPLVVEGCLMMRKCHLNTCPVGVATQDPILRKKFTGQPEHLINYFFFVAEELREMMARLGVLKVQDLIGRTDLLAQIPSSHWKAQRLDLSELLSSPLPVGPNKLLSRNKIVTFDQRLLEKQDGFLAMSMKQSYPVHNTDRSIGTWFSGKITSHREFKNLPRETICLNLEGSAGQSFGAFLVPQLKLHLKGQANDYVGKGLSGGEIIIQHHPRFRGSSADSILVGNTCLYGATSGETYIAGSAGERFAVRNSGALAVVEGVGDHGCEYMTGGRVIILGQTGKNFAAGMSGGLAYIWDLQDQFDSRCNFSLVDVEAIDLKDEKWLKNILQSHHIKTESQRALEILTTWNLSKKYFKKVVPKEYRKFLESPPTFPPSEELLA